MEKLEGKVELSLEEYLELYDFKRGMIDGKCYVITSGSFAYSGGPYFISQDEAVIKLGEMKRELEQDKGDLKTKIYGLEDELKKRSLEIDNPKKKSFWDKFKRPKNLKQ